MYFVRIIQSLSLHLRYYKETRLLHVNLVYMERFTLTAAAGMKWTVVDNESGIKIDFIEGLFNESQKVTYPEDLASNMTADNVKKVSAIMREIGDWLAENHMEAAGCRRTDRLSAIWILANKKYWFALVNAMNSLIVNWDESVTAAYLRAEVEDYISLDNGIGLTEVEACNLRGSISLLDDEEAMEVVDIVYAFWHYKENADLGEWADSVLRWPSLCLGNANRDNYNEHNMKDIYREEDEYGED